jgi:hypothetical protein
LVRKDAGKIVVAYLKVLRRHLPGEIEENHRKPQSRQMVSGPTLESGTSRL